MNVACIVLCAGKGTRMKSSIPKVLHQACGKPMCSWVIDAVMPIIDGPLIAVTGFGADKVNDYLHDRYQKKVKTCLQKDQLGTAHAVTTALPLLDNFKGSVIILCGDTPQLTTKILKSLCTLREKTKSPLAMLTAHIDDPTGYGRIVRDNNGTVVRIVEEKDASVQEKQISEINSGVYAVDCDFLRRECGFISSENNSSEYYLTDLIAIAQKKLEPVVSLTVDCCFTVGVNSRIDLAKTSSLLQKQIIDKWMMNGVSFEDPNNVIVEHDVVLNSDVFIGSGVSLKGNTTIGSGCNIACGCVLQDMKIGKNVEILPYSVCEQAKIGDNVNIGPFARLRAGAKLHENSKVGNFVEIKNSTLEKGAKANHLAYIGDTCVGKKSNIGAGTITCNYDGKTKHKTTIGEEVFIGSNSTLVAPVTIEQGAYIAAASCITNDVNKNSLAFGRAKQINKNNYLKDKND